MLFIVVITGSRLLNCNPLNPDFGTISRDTQFIVQSVLSVFYAQSYCLNNCYSKFHKTGKQINRFFMWLSFERLFDHFNVSIILSYINCCMFTVLFVDTIYTSSGRHRFGKKYLVVKRTPKGSKNS